MLSKAALAQLGERQTEDLKVPGSIPGGGIFSVVSIYGLVGYDVCLTRRRSPVRSWVDVFLSGCGPRGVMETRLPPKEKIVGSSPIRTIFVSALSDVPGRRGLLVLSRQRYQLSNSSSG